MYNDVLSDLTIWTFDEWVENCVRWRGWFETMGEVWNLGILSLVMRGRGIYGNWMAMMYSLSRNWNQDISKRKPPEPKYCSSSISRLWEPVWWSSVNCEERGRNRCYWYCSRKDVFWKYRIELRRWWTESSLSQLWFRRWGKGRD